MVRPNFFTEFVLEPDASVHAITRASWSQPASPRHDRTTRHAAMPCLEGQLLCPPPRLEVSSLPLQLSIKLYMKNVVPIFKSVQGVAKVWVQIASGADENYMRVQQECNNGLRKKFDLAFEEVGRTRLPQPLSVTSAWARSPATSPHPTRISSSRAVSPPRTSHTPVGTRGFTNRDPSLPR